MATDAEDAKQREILALEAKLAIARGQGVTAEHRKLADRYDRDLIEAALVAFPRTRYSLLAGKQLKQLNDIEAQYGVPVGSGADVNLIEVLKWFHTFLAKNGAKLTKMKEADERTLQARDEMSALQIRQMQAQIAKIEADVERKRASAISVEEVRKSLAWLSAELRKLGERLGKRFGIDAQLALNETLERIEASLADEI